VSLGHLRPILRCRHCLAQECNSSDGSAKHPRQEPDLRRAVSQWIAVSQEHKHAPQHCARPDRGSRNCITFRRRVRAGGRARAQITGAGRRQAANEPLSEKLKEGEGVLEPPRGMDPEIHKDAPVPNPDKMPVLPPPGEPGGNPEIQPK
jgi:hypothetical protein